MSVRVYTGRHADHGRPRKRWITVLPWVLAAVAVVSLMLVPFLAPAAAGAAGAAGMVAGAGAAAIHALGARGWAWAGIFTGVTLVAAAGTEALAATTQFPFGAFDYAPVLGPTILGVPLVIPVGWLMLVYPSLLAAQRLATEHLGVAVIVAALLAGLDTAWDAVMTSSGLWSWQASAWALPGASGVPLQNVLGWLLVGFAMGLLLDRLPRKVAKDGVPNVLLSALYVGGVLAAVLAGAPGAAAWTAVGGGLVIVPWWWRMWSEPQW